MNMPIRILCQCVCSARRYIRLEQVMCNLCNETVDVNAVFIRNTQSKTLTSPKPDLCRPLTATRGKERVWTSAIARFVPFLQILEERIKCVLLMIGCGLLRSCGRALEINRKLLFTVKIEDAWHCNISFLSSARVC